MKMLIADDDSELLDILQRGFRAEGITVDVAEDGEHAQFLGRTTEYDIILLDLLMPEKDGCEVCRDLREHNRSCPILILSVNSTVEQKVRLLQAGADDYVSKPFSFRELAARVKALSRRGRHFEPEILRIGDLKLITAQQKVVRGKKEVYLTRKEFSLLEFMLRHKSQVISRSVIMEHVWSSEADPFSNTIEAHILNIRKKIGDTKHNRLLHTVPGRGYKVDLGR